jgi:alpha-ketoglutarate-dependent taurine dioxygenase
MRDNLRQTGRKQRMVEFRAINNSWVKEVIGVKLWEGISPDDLAAVRDEWAKTGVLVFRRQALSESELVAASAIFGTPEKVVRKDWASPISPEIILVSNLKDQDNNQIGMPGSGDVEWHTDQSYVLDPATGAALYGVDIPTEGGGTWWANLQEAYDALPDEVKHRIGGKHAIFSYAKRLAGYDEKARVVSEEVKRKTPDITHPLVNRHPVTGRESLYLDPGTTIGIVGMEKSEGMALLQELQAYATRPEFTYRHDWQVGDVVLWDNGCTLHRRDHYESTQRRFHKRTTMRLPAERHIVPIGERVVESLAA